MKEVSFGQYYPGCLVWCCLESRLRQEENSWWQTDRDRQYTDAPAFLLPRFQTLPGLALICNVCFSCREQVGAACLSLQKKPALSVVFSNRNSRFSVQ